MSYKLTKQEIEVLEGLLNAGYSHVSKSEMGSLNVVNKDFGALRLSKIVGLDLTGFAFIDFNKEYSIEELLDLGECYVGLSIKFINGIDTDRNRKDGYHYYAHTTEGVELGDTVIVHTRLGYSLGRVMSMGDMKDYPLAKTRVGAVVTETNQVFIEAKQHITNEHIKSQMVKLRKKIDAERREASYESNEEYRNLKSKLVEL